MAFIPVGREKVSLLQWRDTRYSNYSRVGLILGVLQQHIKEPRVSCVWAFTWSLFGEVFLEGMVYFVFFVWGLLFYWFVVCFLRKNLKLGGYGEEEDLKGLGERRNMNKMYLNLKDCFK